MSDGSAGPGANMQRFTPVCAIGASAGGVSALRSFFRQIPDDLGLAYVVIVHLAPDHPSALSEILAACTSMPVHEVHDGPALKPDCVYVISPDRELVIEGDSIAARPFTEPRGHRAPIDMFFRSIAAGRGDGLAVVMTGAGSDGAIGIRSIKEAGGVVFVQEPAEAGFPSMPHSAIATGAADFVGPIARLVERIGEVARSKEAVRSLDEGGAANDLRRITTFLRARTGHDFSSYKRATVMRRVLRRMQVNRITSIAEYADYLKSTPEEAQDLFGDLLISVTMFFRDNDAFASLARCAIAPIFDNLEEEGIRAWVAGCATGEEAYSLAILMLEEAERRKVQVPIQIFASDLDEGALATGRQGRYPHSIRADVSDERLARYFHDDGTHYRVNQEVRDCVLFASHSVLRDPPFLRLDLVACRNLLIYLERSLQKQICSIFHYGLRGNRYLFLGSAETADSSPDLFATVERDARIYRSLPKAPGMQPELPQLVADHRVTGYAQAAEPQAARDGRAPTPTDTHASALERFAPPSVLVDAGYNILHMSPTAGRFILHSSGPFTSRLSAVVRPELRLDLKMALGKAFDQKLPTVTHPVAVDMEGAIRRITLSVIPVTHGTVAPVQTLVLFNDGGPAEVDEGPDPEALAEPGEMRRLHAELKAAQEALVASRHEHEASIQDLRAANEELQSINEEYRSTSEELETSKEELQSINEELQTVNAELKVKLQSISSAHSDLQNLTTATEIGTLFLDAQLRIKMFTPPVAALFNIAESDVGRQITDFTHQLEHDGIEREVKKVLRDLAPLESEVCSRNGRWYMMRVRPYRTIEDRIDGTVMTFVDITERLEMERRLAESERRLRALVQASAQVMYRMNSDWSRMRELSGEAGLGDDDSGGDNWFARFIQPEDRQQVEETVTAAVARQAPFEIEYRTRRADGTGAWALARAVPIFDESGALTEWFGIASDITESKDFQERQRVLVAELQHRTRNLLGVVRSLAEKTAEGAESTQSFLAKYHTRLDALSRVNGMLSRLESGQRVTFLELVHAELAAQGGDPDTLGDRVVLDGPADVELRSATLQTFALAIHELTTNATKYGALVGNGRLAVSWRRQTDANGVEFLHLEWIETGVEMSLERKSPMSAGGFGRELIEKALPFQLDARTTYRLTDDGVECTIDLPVRRISQGGNERSEP